MGTCSLSVLVFVLLFLGLLHSGVHVGGSVLLGAFHHVGSTPVVVLLLELFADLVERVLFEQSEETPSTVEGLEDISLLVLALLEEGTFEAVQEQEEVLVIGGQSVLSDDSLHVEGILTSGVESVKLVGHGRMVITSESDQLTIFSLLDSDSGLHESGEGGEDVDWWVNLSVVQVTVNEDLTLGNVPSQVGDGMGDIIVGHGKNGQLGDGSIGALDTSSTLVEGGQIGVHITGETTTSGHFFSGGRDLSEGVGVGRHIGEDGHDVHVLFVGQVLSSGEGETGSNNSLNGGIVGQVHEEHDLVHGAIDFEIGLEESSGGFRDSHSSEDNGEVIFVVIMDVLLLHERGLSADLSTDLIMGETIGREQGDLLSTGDGVHDINGGDTSLDHFLGVISLVRVNRLSLNTFNNIKLDDVFSRVWRTRSSIDMFFAEEISARHMAENGEKTYLDIEEIFGEDWGSMINWDSGTIELATEHLNGDGHLEDITSELAMSVEVIDV